MRNLGSTDVEDLTVEEECGEDASQQSSALEEDDRVCFKMAHGEIATRVGKLTYGVVAADVSPNAVYGTCIAVGTTVQVRQRSAESNWFGYST